MDKRKWLITALFSLILIAWCIDHSYQGARTQAAYQIGFSEGQIYEAKRSACTHIEGISAIRALAYYEFVGQKGFSVYEYGSDKVQISLWDMLTKRKFKMCG